MKRNIFRAGLMALLCLAVAPVALSQPGPPLVYERPPALDPNVHASQLIDCHATFFRSGTGTSYTPPSWKIGVPANGTDNAKMDACKASATQNWLANGKILLHLNYSSSDQDKICRAGKVEVRIDYGWQNPGFRGRQPSFTYQVASPDCSCTCSKPTDTFVPAVKRCATKVSSAPGINNGSLGGDWYGINQNLYQLNTSPYSCAFKPTATRSR